jgi:hypothetical protein
MSESDCITFDNNSQCQVLGSGKIAITTEHSISKVLVESLDYNLLSISQLCEMSYNCLFTDNGVTVFRRSLQRCLERETLPYRFHPRESGT